MAMLSPGNPFNIPGTESTGKISNINAELMNNALQIWSIFLFFFGPAERMRKL